MYIGLEEKLENSLCPEFTTLCFISVFIWRGIEILLHSYHCRHLISICCPKSGKSHIIDSILMGFILYEVERILSDQEKKVLLYLGNWIPVKSTRY